MPESSGETSSPAVRARHRTPIVLVTVLLIALGGYYLIFFKQKTQYFRERNARIIGSLARQVLNTIDATGRYAQQAATLYLDQAEGPSDVQALVDLYQTHGTSRYASQSAIFNEVPECVDKVPSRTMDANGTVHFVEALSHAPELTTLLGIDTTPCVNQNVEGYVSLRKLLDPLVRESDADVFSGLFVLDSSGNVIYQHLRAADSGDSVSIVGVSDLAERNTLGRDTSLPLRTLLMTSRETAVRLGDADYELFSAPLHSTITGPKNDDTWVVCGIVRESEFRTRSLAISVTVVCALLAIVLLVIFSWPFLKVALVTASHRISRTDAILLAICGILASSIVTLAVLDTFAYSRLEAIADDQLRDFAIMVDRRFADDRRNISAQMDDALAWSEEQLLTQFPEPRNGDLLALHPLGFYPWIQSFAFIDTKGWQRVKWFVDSKVTPMVQVAERDYFSDALNSTAGYMSVAGNAGERMTMQSVRSMTTGLPELDCARRSDEHDKDPRHGDLHKRLPVLTMTVPDVLSVGHPIIPADFGFAIIDDKGTVLFHSERKRNTIENFFSETDRDRHLRSAVAARRAEWMNIRYWGRDYRAYVCPLGDVPWTLITFRDKHGLRTLNTEALIVTLLFIVTLVGPGLLFFTLLVLFLRPRYAATWIWPSALKRVRYQKLTRVYAAVFVLASLEIVLLRTSALLFLPFWLVPIVLITAYVCLADPENGPKRSLMVLIAVAFLVMGVVSIAIGGVEPFFATAIDRICALAFALMIALACAYGVKPDKEAPASETLRAEDDRAALPTIYCGVAVALLLLASVIPTVAFFKASYEVEIASYVKSIQLSIAEKLQSRYWRITSDYNNERGSKKGDYAERRLNLKSDIYSDPFFGTQVDFSQSKESVGPGDSSAYPDFLESMLPHYSDASVKTRELVHDASSDRRWWWTPKGVSGLTMSLADTWLPTQRITIRSVVPSLIVGPYRVAGAPLALRILFLAVAAIVLAGVNIWIARFIARHIFFVDVVNQRDFTSGLPDLRRSICPADRDKRGPFDGYASINLKEEKDVARLDALPASFDRKPFERYVLIEGLDYSFATGTRAAALRGMVARTTRNSDRSVVIRPIDMNVITDGLLKGDEAEEWKKVLAPFVWVNIRDVASRGRSPIRVSGSHPVSPEPVLPDPPQTDEHSTLRVRLSNLLSTALGFRAYFEQMIDNRASAHRALRHEIEGDPYLGSLTDGLDADATARDQMLDDIADRAEHYYAALWGTCSIEEQVVLLQLAQTGFVNSKMRRQVRRLLARGLLRRDPSLRLMSETFRRFVLAQASNPSLAALLEPDFATDTWQRFRVPFFVTVGVVALFFMMTQHELFDVTSAIITTAAAMVPTLAKVATAWGERGIRAR